MPSDGIEKVWPTPLPAFELITRNALPFSVATLPVGAGHLPQLLVAQRAARVVLVDGHVDAGVLGHLEHGGVDPLPVRGPDEVGHPGGWGADP